MFDVSGKEPVNVTNQLLGTKMDALKDQMIVYNGLKTVLTDSGVLYASEDGKHILQGPLFDVSGKEPVNVTNQLLGTKMDALKDQMIVY
ncbi:disulfide isomerase DsbC N-terminal domain-containing protein, partial [Enterobacter hormaechei]|uniref:disulfide isomerase DsbC N-terminal domain-containing protein n=1 Tax=Enterobacter hormaechei TaxID=158836 RepID=UPI0023E8E1FB